MDLAFRCLSFFLSYSSNKNSQVGSEFVVLSRPQLKNKDNEVWGKGCWLQCPKTRLSVSLSQGQDRDRDRRTSFSHKRTKKYNTTKKKTLQRIQSDCIQWWRYDSKYSNLVLLPDLQQNL